MRTSPRMLAILALAASACMPEFAQLGPPDTEGDPPDEPQARWERTSLAPLVGYLPESEHERVAIDGVPFSNDLYAAAGVTTSAADKLDEIAAQLAAEWNEPAPTLLDAPSRAIAETVPFRGNPSDVAVTHVDGHGYYAVPLGGDLMVPGNEVALVRDDGGTTRVKVGIRPQRVAGHPAGLFFVCNQYSSYVSVIDAARGALLTDDAGKPVELATDLFCGDLDVVPRDGGEWLVIANPERRHVTATKIAAVREGGTVRLTEGAGAPADVTITDVGPYPARVVAGEDKDLAYVGSTRGDTLASLDLASGAVTRKVSMGAPAVDLVAVAGHTLVPTTMIDRGLLAAPDVPPSLASAPIMALGLDGGQHEVHPGALTDGSAAYGFEDVRNGLLAFDASLGDSPTFFTDDVSPEPAYTQAQKILRGALPQGIARTNDGTRVYVTFGGSNRVQELEVVAGGGATLRPTGRIWDTAARPFGVAVDDYADALIVATWGGEDVEVFDLSTGELRRRTDSGYASPAYPATAIEEGENYFVSARWSNNRRKTCAHCHLDELITDGMSYANGAASPVAMHKVPPNHNLLTTDSYFWNGSLAGGSYRSLAFAAQARTNCEVILFGLVEGPGSNPATRVGDPANDFRSGDDDVCRPDGLADNGLPANFAAAVAVRDAELEAADADLRDATGHGFDEISRLIDFYSVSELRLPPNPTKHRIARGLATDEHQALIARGEAIFLSSGCAGCHTPDNGRAPFSDGLQHGSGRGWMAAFAQRYADDPRVTDLIGELPLQFMQAVRDMPADREINVHAPRLDFFIPFCFDGDECLVFEDPMTSPDEDGALERLVKVNLADERRGFVPGNVLGQPAMNTPSLRGLWGETAFLHHGLARSVAEAVLAPGHEALPVDGHGWAILSDGTTNVHGATATLPAEDVRALDLYLRTIE